MPQAFTYDASGWRERLKSAFDR